MTLTRWIVNFNMGLTRICIYIYTYSCVSVYIYTPSISLQPFDKGALVRMLVCSASMSALYGMLPASTVLHVQ